MNISEKIQQQDEDIKKMLLASLGLHVFVILIFTVKTVFFPSAIPKYHPVIRVDLVGLPKKRNPDKPLMAPAKPEEKNAVELKSKPAPEEKKTGEKKLSKEQNLAINKLKTLAALEKLKNLKENSDQKKDAEKIYGNRISPGTALQGLDKIDFNEYIGSLDAQVKSHWALPEWMSSQNLKAQVLVKIDKNGQIIEKIFKIKSGNTDFDSRVMTAIDASNPFPPPPDKFVDVVEVNGITFAFPD